MKSSSVFLKHTITLLSYTGIGFMSGAISHGFFSGQRSIIMAILGFTLFLNAQFLERKYFPTPDMISSRYDLLLVAIIFPLGVGMFNGGFQHFLDSPQRSLWIIPVGYLLSLLILPKKEGLSGIQRTKTILWGVIISACFAGLIRVAILFVPKSRYSALADDHHNELTGHHTDTHVIKKMRSDFTIEEKSQIHMCLMGEESEFCTQVLDVINMQTYADAIQEQCELMVGMEACATYFGTVGGGLTGEQYDLEASGAYAEIKPTQIVELKNGDSFALSLDNINHTLDGNPVRMMGYNGSIPGPLIKVTQGDEITLNVTNNISDIESTVHHHGVRLDARYDGVPTSMGGFDVPMKKGDTLTYKIKFPDAGLFRYHPHVREDMQQELGLYGNYLVVPKDAGYWNQVDQEELLILDDIQLSGSAIAPFYKEFTNQSIMGRFGTHFLVNGQDDYTLRVKQNQVTRLYITNSANVRAFTFAIPGVRMKLVGGDIGAYEHETMIDTLLVAPAERYIVEIAPTKVGSFPLEYKNPAFTKALGTLVVQKNDAQSSAFDVFDTLSNHAQVKQDIASYTKYFDKPVDKTLRIDMTLHGKTSKDLSLKMQHPHGTGTVMLGGLAYDLTKIERQDEMFAMNVGSTDKNTVRKLIDEETKKENMDIDWDFKQGDIVKVRIINDGEGLHPMQHPIHFHGQRFLVVNKNGILNDNLVRKDTVLILPGEYVDILIDMSNPGSWMAHCHIAEHMHAGMMMHFSVTSTGDVKQKHAH